MEAGKGKEPKSVLIVSCKEDVHPNPVIRYLKAQDQSVFRLNTEDLLTAYSVTLRQTPLRDFLRIVENGHERAISLESIGSIWYRRPQKPIAPRALEADFDAAEFATNESESFLRILYPLLSDKFWLSPPWLLNFERSKIKQLAVARDVGMSIPETLFTNDPAEATAFAKKHKRIALKTLNARGFTDNQQYRAFYTTIIGEDELTRNLDSICHSINFIQQAVPKRYELRVTVVGEEIFAAAIHSQAASELARDDWRRVNFDEIGHEKAILPVELEGQIRRFMKVFQLPFGCLDFIVTPSGDHVFLECNGNGQWLWIENLTGHPISTAIGNLLHRNCES